LGRGYVQTPRSAAQPGAATVDIIISIISIIIIVIIARVVVSLMGKDLFPQRTLQKHLNIAVSLQVVPGDIDRS